MFKHLQEATQKYNKSERDLRELLPLKVIEARYDEIIKAFVQCITPNELAAIKADLKGGMPKDAGEVAEAVADITAAISKYGKVTKNVFKNSFSVSLYVSSGLNVNPSYVYAKQEPEECHHILVQSTKSGRLLYVGLYIAEPNPYYTGNHPNVGQKTGRTEKAVNVESVDEAIEAVHDMYKLLVTKTKKMGLLPGSKHEAE